MSLRRALRDCSHLGARPEADLKALVAQRVPA